MFSERSLGQELKQLMFTMVSLASGCQHCQSHGAFHLNALGVDRERIRALWQYESSDLFSDAERAAITWRSVETGKLLPVAFAAFLMFKPISTVFVGTARAEIYTT